MTIADPSRDPLDRKGLSIVPRNARAFVAWSKRLISYAMREAEMVPDLTENYWRQCFDDGMTPEQAFAESFVEEDGL